MRVLMLSSLWPPTVIGGAEIYAEELARRLRARGHDVGVITRGVMGDEVIASIPSWPYLLSDFNSQPRWKRTTFHAIDMLNLVAWRAVLSAVDEYQPDVVHSHSIQGMSALPLRVSSARPVAHVHTIHDYWLICQRTSMTNSRGLSCVEQCRPCQAVTALRRRELQDRGPQVVLSVSEAAAREHDRIPQISARIRILPLPADDCRRGRPRGVNHPPVFGYLGQLAPHKGLLTLLEAFRRLPDGSAKLRIAGRGSLEHHVTSNADRNIEYVGFVGPSAKAAFLQSIDCLVVPSEWREPGALVVSEAKSDLLPVIAARCGGLPEVVPTSCSELLFHPGDPADLVRSLQAFCATPARFAVTREPGAGWDAHLHAVLDAYETALVARSQTSALPSPTRRR
jgi:glycosyltransferase involved in cell wall biosynthesis